MAKLSASYVARLALQHLNPDAAIIAVAIAKAESNFEETAVGDVHLQNETWGPSFGLWQVRSLKAEAGKGTTRDGTRLQEATFNAKSMSTISRGGTYWTPWSVYKSGAYERHLGMAYEAVREALTITPQIMVIKKAIEMAFREGVDYKNLGVYNRRYIRGTTKWSQHAWGNAFDLGFGTKGMQGLDVVHSVLYERRRRGELPIGSLLWRTTNHYDHIHVEAADKKTGTPPVLPKNPLGATTTPSLEEEVELIKAIQTGLNFAGFKGTTGEPLKVDGIWGKNTQHAFQEALKARGGSSTQVPPHTHKVTVE